MKLSPITGKRKKTKPINEWIGDAKILRKDDSKILPPPLYCSVHILSLWIPSDYHGQDTQETDDRCKKAVDMHLGHNADLHIANQEVVCCL